MQSSDGGAALVLGEALAVVGVKADAARLGLGALAGAHATHSEGADNGFVAELDQIRRFVTEQADDHVLGHVHFMRVLGARAEQAAFKVVRQHDSGSGSDHTGILFPCPQMLPPPWTSCGAGTGPPVAAVAPAPVVQRRRLAGLRARAWAAKLGPASAPGLSPQWHQNITLRISYPLDYFRYKLI